MIGWQQYLDAFAQSRYLSENNSRYLPSKEFHKKLKSFSQEFSLTQTGKSEKGKPIYALKFGYGKQRVLAWSQMHGNESTGTFAILDLLQLLHENFILKKQIEDHFTIAFVPMVNPDGADVFERRNASGIDLNRDAVAKQAPETKALFKFIESFDPHIALNLHDQRSIFSVGEIQEPATISFCVPSFDKSRKIDEVRAQGMNLVGEVWKSFPKQYQTRTGRYTDEFYPTAIGDNIQKNGINCILFEAGAGTGDPKRIEARNLFGFGFLKVIEGLTKEQHLNTDAYFQIPENEQKMRDIIVSKVKLNSRGRKLKVDLVFKLVEEVKGTNFNRYLFLDDIGDFQFLNALQKVDAHYTEYSNQEIFLGKQMTFQEFQQTFWEGVII